MTLDNMTGITEGSYTRSYNYCPNCGARMYKGGEDK